MTTVYYNGDILSMEGDGPQYVECLVTQDNEIVFAGDMSEAGEFMSGEDKSLVDLEGKCLMPGFIDPHIHPSMAGW